jgi:hypothetical protein
MIRTTMAVATALTLSLSTVAHAMSLGECVIRNDAADKKVTGILTLRTLPNSQATPTSQLEFGSKVTVVDQTQCRKNGRDCRWVFIVGSYVDHSDAAPDKEKGERIEGWGWVPRSVLDCTTKEQTTNRRARPSGNEMDITSACVVNHCETESVRKGSHAHEP